MTLIFKALGFPEFESCHSIPFAIEAQFSKSAASTVPPRPLINPPYSTIGKGLDASV